MSIRQHSWWMFLECPLEGQVLGNVRQLVKSETVLVQAMTLCHYSCLLGTETSKTWSMSTLSHLSSFRYWGWLSWAPWAGPAMRCKILSIPDNDLTMTTQTWCVNWSRQTSGMRRDFAVHGLYCCSRQRKCYSHLSTLKTVLYKECEKDWCTVNDPFVHIGIC